jgi:predicted permease
MALRDWIDTLRYDVRHTLRTLGREPSLVLGVVLTFALAIGTNAAMFGLIRQLMLAAPAGIRDPQSVVRAQLIRLSDDGNVFASSTMSYPAFTAIRASNAALSVAATHGDTLIMGSGDNTMPVATMSATGEYFGILGARPALGRFIGAADDDAGIGNPVVVLSHSFWQRQFNGDATVLGRELTIADQRYTIVGVAPSGFNGDVTSRIDLFLPLSAAFANRHDNWRTNPGFNLVNVVARLRPNATPRAAGSVATSSFRRTFADRYDEQATTVELESVVPGKSARQSLQAKIALWLAGVALVVMLIATANVATLLLVRAVKRRREMAVRIALGVGRARLARQLLTESLVLAAGGAVVGLVVAEWLSHITRATLLPNLAPTEQVIEPPLLVATAVIAILAGVVAGLAPMAQIVQRGLTDELHGGSAPGSIRRARSQAILVGVQVALCMILLVGAGAFVRSLDRVSSQDLGFSTARLLLVELSFRTRPTGPERDQRYTDLAERVARLDGVSRASIVAAIPFGYHNIPPISVPGRAEPPSAGGQLPIMYPATPAYLDMIGVKLLQGRLITDADAHGSPPVALVNETMAREVWPGQSAIGKCIRIGFDLSGPPTPLAPATLPCREIVGVVRDSRARSLQRTGREATLMQYYVPFTQIPPKPFANASDINAILVRVTGDADRMIGAVQQRIQSAAGTSALARVRPYQDLLDPQLRPWRLGATLFSVFGTLAVVIAAVGLFGVISCLVSQRTAEMGIRLALGGSRGNVARFVVGQSVRMVAIGLAIGGGIALLLAPFAQALLFETSARDVTILSGASAVLLVVSVIAAILPAWRASTVSPLTALRND